MCKGYGMMQPVTSSFISCDDFCFWGVLKCFLKIVTLLIQTVNRLFQGSCFCLFTNVFCGGNEIPHNCEIQKICWSHTENSMLKKCDLLLKLWMGGLTQIT